MGDNTSHWSRRVQPIAACSSCLVDLPRFRSAEYTRQPVGAESVAIAGTEFAPKTDGRSRRGIPAHVGALLRYVMELARRVTLFVYGT